MCIQYDSSVCTSTTVYIEKKQVTLHDCVIEGVVLVYLNLNPAVETSTNGVMCKTKVKPW